MFKRQTREVEGEEKEEKETRLTTGHSPNASHSQDWTEGVSHVEDRGSTT